MMNIENYQTPKYITMISLLVLFVIFLISFGIMKMNESQKEEPPKNMDYILKCFLPGLIISLLVAAFLYFYKKTEPEIILSKEDFWD